MCGRAVVRMVVNFEELFKVTNRCIRLSTICTAAIINVFMLTYFD